MKFLAFALSAAAVFAQTFGNVQMSDTVEITDGEMFPSFSDNTRFVSTCVGQSDVQQFEVVSPGMTEPAVTVDNPAFVIDEFVAGANGTWTFTIRFSPQTGGQHPAVVSLGDVEFGIEGEGIDATLFTDVVDETTDVPVSMIDFGQSNEDVVRSFVVRNRQAICPASISPPRASDVEFSTITGYPTGTLSALQEAVFQITFVPEDSAVNGTIEFGEQVIEVTGSPVPCTDLANMDGTAAADIYGDTCDNYANTEGRTDGYNTEGLCAFNGGPEPMSNGLTPQQSCCACGGGDRPALDLPCPDGSQELTSPSGAQRLLDPFGDTCDFYSDEMQCAMFGLEEMSFRGTVVGTVNEVCCLCRELATRVVEQPPCPEGTCCDYMVTDASGMFVRPVDVFGDDCTFYDQGTNAEQFCPTETPFPGTPRTNQDGCCACIALLA